MLHGVAVGRLHAFGAGDGTDEHEQRRFGQMEIGDDVVDDFLPVARRDENVGFAGKRVQDSVIVGGAFQQTQRGCADGDNAVAVLFRFVYYLAGVRGNDAVFGVHLMVFGVFDFDRQESSGADMQGQENLFDAFFIQSLQDARGKMQAGGR